MSALVDPASVIDISRAPRGELAAAELVNAVARVGDLAERHYLELKGPPDFDSKVNKQKVAKFILGAANRQPSRAAEAFEGFGVMVVGITANGAEGVPPVEMLSLSQVVKPFLGEAGPRWDIVRVPVANSTNQVILVIVDPPEAGQPPFICRASGEGLVDGRIYYRADGETREPTSDELDHLMARGAAVPQAPVDLRIEMIGKIVPVTVDQTRTLEEYLSRTRARLLAALPQTPVPIDPSDHPGPRLPGSTLAAAALALASESNSLVTHRFLFGADEPEKRTEDQYREEIARWETSFRAAWPSAMESFLAHSAPVSEVRVVNLTRTYIHDLVVDLHIEGDVEAVDWESSYEDGPDWGDLKLPWPPRKWGPTKRDPTMGLGSQPIWTSPSSLYASPTNYIPPSTSWKNGGSVDVRVNVGDLRPEATFESDDAGTILVVRTTKTNAFQATWRATARGYNEVFVGAFEVAVDETTVLTDLFRKFLKL